MPSSKKLLQAAAGAAGGAGLNIPEVFSVQAYDGNGSSQTINNGIDLSGEGGLVWCKQRTGSSSQHALFDTERGTLKGFSSSSLSASATETSVTSFNSNGFSLGTFNNTNNQDYISWTFRRAEKFFDVISWDGDGTNAREISHNLGAVPHMVITRPYSTSTGGWSTLHYDGTTWRHGEINTTDSVGSSPSAYIWGDRSSFIQPTDSVITVAGPLSGVSDGMNKSGVSYISYLFAHNDGDGTFGPDGDADIIKCGSYTGTGSNTLNEIDLGFEPQFIMTKRVDGSGDWNVYDNKRYLGAYDTTCAQLYWNRASEENNQLGGPYADIYSNITGFSVRGSSNMFNATNNKYIYMAIRAGDLTPPEHGDEAYATDTWGGGPPAYYAGFAPDMVIEKDTSTGIAWTTSARFMAGRKLQLQESGSIGTWGSAKFESSFGFYDSTASLTQYRAWMWQNRPKYFRCYGYVGNGASSRTFTHDLGAVPKMIWVKAYNADERNGDGWQIYHFGADDTAPENYYMTTDDNGSRNSDNAIWDQTQPTDTEWYTGTNHAVINETDGRYFVALFAELAGVTKIGSYTMQSGGTDVDCGFSNGPRFVMIKSRSGARDWMWFDSARGIVAGNDPYLRIGENSGNVTSQDVIDPISSGFHIPQSGNGNVANVGETYMFYAIGAE